MAIEDFFRFDNKHIVIAGGTSGIGLAVAREVKSLGARVTIIGRNLQSLESLGQEGYVTVANDLFDIQSLKNLVEQIDAFDGLLWAAGAAETPRPFGTLSVSVIEDLMVKNCYAPFEFIAKAQKLRKLNAGASICYVSSVTERCGASGSGGYSASKAAFSALSRSMGHELAKKGVRINSVAYGYIKTKFLDGLSISEDMINRIPLGLPDAMQASGVSTYLLSDASKYITRQTIIADSGVTLHQAMA